MKKNLKLMIILTVLTGTNELQGQDQPVDFDKNFTHVVYFYLNNPDNPEDRSAFENSLKKFLDNSLYAKTKFIGIPAETPRDVVDNSYTYSLIQTFPSKEIQNKYQEEPAHLVFVEESSHLWKKVQVYDSVGIY
ncbi:MAG TPA: Dabb family protein [Gillisia sp.]|nr:Dabb family protein [Gillisia sp.]